MDISLIMASKRVQSLKHFLKSSSDLCHDPSRVEIIIGIDRGNQEMVDLYDSWKGHTYPYPFKISFVILDNPKGYFGLGYVYDGCFMSTHPSSYFVQICNDKLRFTCKYWDDKYMSYKGSFDDDIFVVRTSSKREWVRGSLYTPDNFRLYTKKMYNLLEGHGDYWSADSWHEPTLNYLGSPPHSHDRQVVCDVGIFDAATEIASPLSGRAAGDPGKIEEGLGRIGDPKYHEYTYKRIAKKLSDYIEEVSNHEKSS